MSHCIKSIILAGLYAAVVSSLSVGLIAASYSPDRSGAIPIFLLGVAIGVPLALLGAVLIGLPVHIGLRRYRQTSLWLYLGAGLIAGLILFGILLTHEQPGASSPTYELSDYLYVASIALGPSVAALTFWLQEILPMLSPAERRWPFR